MTGPVEHFPQDEWPAIYESRLYGRGGAIALQFVTASIRGADADTIDVPELITSNLKGSRRTSGSVERAELSLHAVNAGLVMLLEARSQTGRLPPAAFRDYIDTPLSLGRLLAVDEVELFERLQSAPVLVSEGSEPRGLTLPELVEKAANSAIGAAPPLFGAGSVFMVTGGDRPVMAFVGAGLVVIVRSVWTFTQPFREPIDRAQQELQTEAGQAMARRLQEVLRART